MARCDVALDQFSNLGVDGGSFAHDAAVRPLDLAVADREFGLGEYDQAAREAALLCHALESVARLLIQSVIDPDHQMRRRYQMLEAIADQFSDLGKRFGFDQRTAQFASGGDGDINRFGLQSAFDFGELSCNGGDAVADLLEGRRDSPLALGVAFALPRILDRVADRAIMIGASFLLVLGLAALTAISAMIPPGQAYWHILLGGWLLLGVAYSMSVTPGGRLLIADFAPHDREELRAQDAHTRLGFSDAQIERWFAAAGLTLAKVETLAGGELTVKLWLGVRQGAALREVKAA